MYIYHSLNLSTIKHSALTSIHLSYILLSFGYGTYIRLICAHFRSCGALAFAHDVTERAND